MVEPHCCFIKEDYFIEHLDYKNLLDTANSLKQSQRTHVCVEIDIGNNKVYIPLRNNLGEPVRKFGKIGFPVPTDKRPNAGLDYRYMLIINDPDYIEPHKFQKLPASQYRTIANNYETIKQEVTAYITKYIKVARKGRVHREALYRVSSLVNFDKELGVYTPEKTTEETIS